MHQFIYNGRNSADFNLVLSGEDTWKKPLPDIERMQIPGRNGDLLLSNKRYGNVEIKYHVGIRRNFDTNYSAFMNFLLKEPGYHRLEDSYHGDYYRMAVLDKEVSPTLSALNYGGSFDLVFSCMPQQYLKSGERLQVLTGSGTVYNPTAYEAKPLLRIYGSGSILVGDGKVTVTDNESYIDLDCELEDAFRDTVNMNQCLELESGDFPVLTPGNNSITFISGITKVELVPRWWCL